MFSPALEIQTGEAKRVFPEVSPEGILEGVVPVGAEFPQADATAHCGSTQCGVAQGAVCAKAWGWRARRGGRLGRRGPELEGPAGPSTEG